MTRPIIVTCGEPAGIGLEIAQKAWAKVGERLPFVLIADRRHVTVDVEELSDISDYPASAGALPLLHHNFAQLATPGTADAENAKGVIDVIARAVELVQSGAGSAICTLPIHKKALMDGAGFAYPGHTEYLANLAGVERVVMMLACPELKVVPTTIHIALEHVATSLTSDLLKDTIQITHRALRRDFGLSDPRLAIAGLNPHAGEGGAMGHQEEAMIAPVLDQLRADGLQMIGPLSADTMFHAGARAKYDAAICMYHDQALIPIKTLDFAGGVNVTLGLPFVRTSPDHGTAFDIAGQNIADDTSFIAALELAHSMAKNRAVFHGAS